MNDSEFAGENYTRLGNIESKLNLIGEQCAQFNVVVASFEKRLDDLEKKYDRLIFLSLATLSSIVCGVVVFLATSLGG